MRTTIALPDERHRRAQAIARDTRRTSNEDVPARRLAAAGRYDVGTLSS